MKKEDEFDITEIDMEEMAHLIHVIPTPDLLRICIGYEVILDKPFTRQNFIDMAFKCMLVAKEMLRDKNKDIN